MEGLITRSFVKLMQKASMHIVIVVYCIRFQFVCLFFRQVTQQLPQRVGQMAFKRSSNATQSREVSPNSKRNVSKECKGKADRLKTCTDTPVTGTRQSVLSVALIKTQPNIYLKLNSNMNDEE